MHARANKPEVSVALLYQIKGLHQHLENALTDWGARVVYSSVTAEYDAKKLEQSGATVVIVNLDPDVVEDIDQIEELLSDESKNVIFNDGEVSSRLSGWEQARWARHLAAKILGSTDTNPPRPLGSEQVTVRAVKALPASMAAIAETAVEPIEAQKATGFGDQSYLAEEFADDGLVPEFVNPPQNAPAVNEAPAKPVNLGALVDEFVGALNATSNPNLSEPEPEQNSLSQVEFDEIAQLLESPNVDGSSQSTTDEPSDFNSISEILTDFDFSDAESESQNDYDDVSAQEHVDPMPVADIEAQSADVGESNVVSVSGLSLADLDRAEGEQSSTDAKADVATAIDSQFDLSRFSLESIEGEVTNNLPIVGRATFVISDPADSVSNTFVNASQNTSVASDASDTQEFLSSDLAVLEIEADATQIPISDEFDEHLILDESQIQHASDIGSDSQNESTGLYVDFDGSLDQPEVAEVAGPTPAIDSDSQNEAIGLYADFGDFLDQPDAAEVAGATPEIDLNSQNEATGLHADFDDLLDQPEAAEVASSAPAIDNIWVLGASIGGPDAVRDFLRNIPENIPAVFVLAQHMGIDFFDLMVAQLERASKLRIRKIKDGDIAKHGEVLVAPLQQRFEIDSTGLIKLSALTVKASYSPSIDQVAIDLAEQFGSNAGLIIFSGMAGDAILGAQAMHAKGGQVWVQNPETCVISTMVEGARSAGVVSFEGRPAELAQKISARLAEAK